MEASSIRSLRPNVTRDEALAVFTSPGPATLYWRMRAGRLQRIAEAYLPYRVYRVRYRMGGAQHAHLFALDAVEGSLDLFEFAAPPAESELVQVATRNHPRIALDEGRAERLLREKVLRVVFQQGFFKLRKSNLEVELLPGQIHLPYWLGFYGHEKSLRCRVLDAVRRRIEGAKAAALFEQWLAA
ncbi:MAG TPA: hypothetical protein VMT51_07715 [Dongiaceae bacterium]|nr:hypothetical protein [Dongiaceae bacterium]